MKKSALLFLLLFCNMLHSQSFSIKKTLEKCSEINQEIENEQDETIWAKRNQDLKKIVLSNVKIKTLSENEKKEFAKYYSIVLLNEGAFQTLKSKYTESIISYKKSFTVAQKIKYYEGCASSLQNIGTSFDYLGKIDSSLAYFKKALNYAYSSKNQESIAFVLTDLGYVNNNIGNNKLAIEYNLKALKIFKKLNDSEGIERTNFSIGRIFDNLKEYEKSLEYYSDALQISIATKNEQRQCLNLNSIVNIYFLQKKYSKAKELLDQCLTICKKNQYISISGVSYNLLGDIDFELKKFNEAKIKYLLANTIFKNDANNFFYSKTLFKLAQLNLKENNIKSAQEYAIECYKLSLKNNYPFEIRSAADLLSQIYTKQKNYKLALDFKNIVATVSDSIYYDENKNNILKAEYKYNSSLKEAQIKALFQEKKIANLESQRQKTIVLILGIALVSILITSYILFNRYKIKKQNELLKSQLFQAQKTIEAEKKATESELKALKSQMNPHFIFNALSSIQDQFMFGDKVTANEQMGNFTYLTRQILNVSGKKQILLSREIDILSKYLELEKMRFKTDFEYKITTSENIDEDYHEIPPMLIQPFVENSINHGLLHKIGIKKVTIHFELDTNEEYIICTITDNGIGRAKSAEIKAKNQSKHQSFSTESIAQRLELLTENHSVKQLITYSDELENDAIVGTKVVVNIPLG